MQQSLVALMAGMMLWAPYPPAVGQVVEALDDFDARPSGPGRQSCFFGLMGVWENGGSSAEYQLVPEARRRGRFLRLSYRLVPGTAGAGLYFELAPRRGKIRPSRDLRRYESLRLRMRAVQPGAGNVWIELADAAGGVSRESIGTPGREWRQYTVPVHRFSGVDLSQAEKLAVVLRPGPRGAAGELDFDDIVFICRGPPPRNVEALLDMMLSRACDYFRYGFHPATGLVWDRAGAPHVASIAATGFGLAALCIAAEHGLMERREAAAMAALSLRTLLQAPQAEKADAAGAHGFFYHFLRSDSARRAGRCEVSSIDTAILLIGALTSGEYFGGEVRELAQQLYARVDWRWMLDERTGLFYMAWRPEVGFSSARWGYYTDEAMLICLLAVGAPDPGRRVSEDCMWAWRRQFGAYGGRRLVQSWTGSLFTYLFCSLWIDLRGWIDRHPTTPVNWWENARAAAEANARFCRDLSDRFATYREGRWGITACLSPVADAPHSPGAWRDFGAAPCGNEKGPRHEGVLAPYGAAMALPLFGGRENIARAAVWSFWQRCPGLWGVWGFQDGCLLAEDPADDWYAHDYVAIAQGPLLLGIENSRSGMIWRLTDKVSAIRQARDKLFRRAGK